MIKQLIARRLDGEVQKQWSVSMQVGCELVEHYQPSHPLTEYKARVQALILHNGILCTVLVGMIAML